MWLDVQGALPTCSRVPRGQTTAVGAGVVWGWSQPCVTSGVWSVVCVMLAKRINQNSQNLNFGVGSRLARGQHK